MFQRLRDGWIACLLMAGLPLKTLAENRNPFPTVDLGGGNVVAGAGKMMQSSIQYTLLAVGGFLVLIGIGVLIQRLREDSKEKEHGNMLMTIVIVALCITIGLSLIGIAWTAMNAQIT